MWVCLSNLVRHLKCRSFGCGLVSLTGRKDPKAKCVDLENNDMWVHLVLARNVSAFSWNRQFLIKGAVHM